MANLLDYVGADSRVGQKNNIWALFLFFFYNAGEGTFSELSPSRITFSGNTTSLGRTEPFNLQVELLSNTRCNVIFQGAARNIPYRIQDNTFYADLSTDALFIMSRYNNSETFVSVSVLTGDGGATSTTYHIQPV
ncbi:MAG: hypothetical protein N3I35_06475 [Clostridia bacterium]|nr:hypothetical protein [Clostridia bacterium]